MKRFPLITVVLAILACLIHVIPGASTLLELDRPAVMRGEAWRLWTAHLTHFGGDHLRWDLMVFTAMGGLLEFMLMGNSRPARRALAMLLGVSALAISVGILCFQPRFTSYRGLSGIDCALFGAVLMVMMRQAWLEHTGRAGSLPSPPWLPGQLSILVVGALALAAFGAKCIFELTTGAAVFVNEKAASFEPVPLAHLVGATVGAIGSVLLHSAERRYPRF